jgi:hypothetical protein
MGRLALKCVLVAGFVIQRPRTRCVSQARRARPAPARSRCAEQFGQLPPVRALNFGVEWAQARPLP